LKKLVRDVWTGLRTGPARAGLAFLSLALGLFAVTILLATLDALRRQAQELVQSFGAGSIVLLPAGADVPPPHWNRRQVDFFREYLGTAAAVSGVKALPPISGADFSVATTDEHLVHARGWRIVAGRPLDGLDVQQGARHAMAPIELCKQRQWRLGELILLGRAPYRLVGCFDAGGDPAPGISPEAVFIPHTADDFERGGPEALTRVDVLLFRAMPEFTPETLQRRVAALLRQPGLGTEGVEWVTPKSLLQGIRRWQRTIGWTAGVGGALALLLGGVTLAGMLLTGVRERIAEIGLRRALGAQPGEIAGLFVAEALGLTFAAAAAGMLAAEGVLRWLGGRFPLPVNFGATTRIFPLALAAVIALICSTGPAWWAARLPPAEALRNE
jgi:putative ABC transport system permease protein